MTVDTRPVTWPTLVPEEPIQVGPLAVYALSSTSPCPAEPGYLLLEHGIKEGFVEITEVSDAGCVPTIALINNGTLPVLAVQGQELVGAKQNRTLNVSLLAPSGRTEIPVTCVERGRWGYRSTRFDSGSFEHYSLRRMKLEMMHAAFKRSVENKRRYLVDQMAVWAEVDRESARQKVQSATSALSDVYMAEGVQSQLAEFEVLTDLPAATVGVIVAIGGELVAAEFLESPDVFANVWPKLLRAYALSAIGRDDCDCPPRVQAETLLSFPSGTTPSVTESVALGEDIRWEGRTFLASALVHEGRMLHGTLFHRVSTRNR